MREVWQMMASGKLRLIGPMVISKVVEGRGFFIGPGLYYLLAVLALIFNWNVVLMTKALILVWWLAALGILFWLGKRFSWLAGLAAYGVFASLPFLIDYSRLMWNPNFLPLFGLGFFWLLEELWQKEKLWYWFLLGLFLGLGINFHYVALIWGVILLPFLVVGIWRRKYKFYRLGLILFILGTILGDLPIFIFELRHNFYNLKTILFFYLKEGVAQGEGGISLGYYFLFALLPVFFWLFSYFIFRFEKKFGLAKIMALTLIIFLSLAMNIDWQKQWGTGMPKGWNIEKQRLVANLVCQEVKKEKTNGKFEIAATISGDTRAGDLRWWLFQEGCTPLGVEDYPKTDILYLVAPEQRIPEKETVWEVSVLKPFSIAKSKSLNDGIMFHKLVRKKQ